MGTIVSHVLTDWDIQGIANIALDGQDKRSRNHNARPCCGLQKYDCECPISITNISDSENEELIPVQEISKTKSKKSVVTVSQHRNTKNERFPLITPLKKINDTNAQTTNLKQQAQSKKNVAGSSKSVVKKPEAPRNRSVGKEDSKAKIKKNISSTPKAIASPNQSNVTSKEVTPSTSVPQVPSIQKEATISKIKPLPNPGSNQNQQRKSLQIIAKFKPVEGQDFVTMKYELNLETKEEMFSSDATADNLVEFELDMDKNENLDTKNFHKSLPKLMNRFEGTVLLNGYLISMDRQQSQGLKALGFKFHDDPPRLIINLNTMQEAKLVRSPKKFEVRIQSELEPAAAKWIRIEGDKVSEIKAVTPPDSTGKLYILLP